MSWAARRFLEAKPLAERLLNLTHGPAFSDMLARGPLAGARQCCSAATQPAAAAAAAAAAAPPPRPFFGFGGSSARSRGSLFGSRRSLARGFAHKAAPLAAAAGQDGGAASSSSNNGSSGGRRKEPRTDLREIKGVGPQYERLLLLKGLTSVAQLQEQLHCTYQGRTDLLQKFLQEEVGIRNSCHCAWVAQHIEGLEWVPPGPRVTLAVEGNIGAGKSTFLSMLGGPSMREVLAGAGGDHLMELQDVVEVVPEPVDEWQCATAPGPDGQLNTYNLLQKFYSDPKRYAYTFQNYVLLSRIRRERDTRTHRAPLRVLERSIFSDRLVFVRAMHEAGRMEDWEVQMYDSWFNMEVQKDMALAPNGFVYLRAQPDTCAQRMRRRARSEETGVPQEYLQQLHSHHEDWLFHNTTRGQAWLQALLGQLGPARARQDNGYLAVELSREGGGYFRSTTELQRLEPTSEQRAQSAVLSAAGEAGKLKLILPEDKKLLDLPKEPRSIEGQVVFLQGFGTEKQRAQLNILQDIPALVLDHDRDSLNDPEAQRHQAQQVSDFFAYVAEVKKLRQAIQAQQGAMPEASGAEVTAIKCMIEELKSELLRSTSASQEQHQRMFASIDRMEAMLAGAHS